jgi:hypothetical protein
MKLSDWSLLALNVLATFVAFVGGVESEGDAGMVVFLFVAVAAFVNSLVIARRARSAEPAAARADEFDARTVLDIDARLEALERAQTNADDAAKWRALVASGQVRGPAPEPADAAAVPRQPLANGR